MEDGVEILEAVVEILVHHWTAHFSVGYSRLISAAAAVLCCCCGVAAVLLYCAAGVLCWCAVLLLC